MSAPCGSSEQADGLKEGFEEEKTSVILNPQTHGGLLGSRQIYTGFHVNGTPGGCAKGSRGQIRGDEGYIPEENQRKLLNPARSGHGGLTRVQEVFLEGMGVVERMGCGHCHLK